MLSYFFIFILLVILQSEQVCPLLEVSVFVLCSLKSKKVILQVKVCECMNQKGFLIWGLG